MTVTRRSVLLGGLATLLAGCASTTYDGEERTLTIAAGKAVASTSLSPSCWPSS